MARPLRVPQAGAWYHVTARGTDRRAIFTSERDRRHWLELMPEFHHRFRLVLHAYVLMGNHFHLLIQTPEPLLSSAMQWLQTSYSMWFNRKHERVGPLFQGRYNAVLVQPESWGLAVSRYLHLNPIRIRSLGLGKSDRQTAHAGLSPAPDRSVVRERLRRLRDYRWSSYRAYIGVDAVPPWLECQHVLQLGGGRTLAERREKYQRYAEEAIREGLPETPWQHLIGQVALGARDWWRQVRQSVTATGREQPQWKAVQPRASWESVIQAVAQVRGLSWDQFKGKRGDWGRDLALYLGRMECALSLKELGNQTAMDYAAVSAAIKRIAHRASDERKFMKLITTVRSNLKFET